MTKSRKNLLAFLTFLPLGAFGIAIIGFIVMFFTIFSMGQNPPSEPPIAFFGGFFVVWILMFVTSIIGLGLMIYYLIDVAQDKTIDSNEQLIWILVLIFASFIGNVAYWFVRIRNRPSKSEILSDDYMKQFD